MGNNASKKQSSKKPTKTTKNWFKPKRQTVKNALIFSIIIIAILGIGELGRKAGYWGEPDALRLIKTEKIASKDLLGLELVESEQFGDGILLQRKVPPLIQNWFRIEDDEMEKITNEIAKYAESDGWVQNTSYHNNWVGRKRLKNDLELTLFINKYEDEGKIMIYVGVH